MTKVLILTQPKDLHAHTVALALAARGAEPVLWHTSDFPSRARESLCFEVGARRLRVVGPDGVLDDDGVDVVWHRRPSLHVIDPGAVAPADRALVELGCAGFRRGVFDGLAADAFWVNDYASSLRAESKLRQHRHAIAAGLDTPATLYSNDPDQIRAFIRRCGGTVAFKPITPLAWRDQGSRWVSYTTTLTEAQLVDDELLQAVPSIFQELVPKAYELRLTMIGRHALTARLRSQDTTRGRLDWRRSYDELVMEPYAAPAALIARCAELMARLGLVFGCFDFIVTPDGRSVFLEVNQMGQFLFVERYAGLPVLDCFTEMLVAGRPDFAWDPARARLRYDQLEAPAMRALERDLSIHVEHAVREQDERAPA